jgi:nickel/cobalt exporter
MEITQIYEQAVKQLVMWQYDLNSYISTTIRSINDENSLIISLTVIGIAFLYGLIHAAGPGHGKALVAFYFTSNKGSYKKAFKLGFMVSIIHSISALLVTFSLFFIIKTMFRKNFNEYYDIAMMISAVMIIIVGFYLIYDAYKHKKAKDEKIVATKKSDFWVAFSAGVVPCPGVMTITLFCLMLGHYELAIYSAVAMSIGMGLTISLAGILSVSINQKANAFFFTNGYLLEMFGGLLIIILGSFLLSNALI